MAEGLPTAAPSVEEVVALVREWLASETSEEGAPRTSDAGARRLAQLLADRDGLEFTLAFVDRVIRPEDLRVAAHNLEAISHRAPRFLPWYLRAAIVAGGGFGILLPWPIIPIARRVFRRMVGHLVVDADPDRLGAVLARLSVDGTRLNLNLLGEAVLGDREAQRRLEGIRALLARRDVDYVSVKVSAVAAHLSLWGFERTVDELVTLLTPLYEQAAGSRIAKFVNLDMEEYRDLDLTIATFTRLLEQPQLRELEAGIVLQAYLPDALGALQELTGWARRRVAEGGAPIKVRLVKGANLPMERVDAAIHGWQLATWGSKQSTDAHYKRMLDWALTPRNASAVRLGVAGHNLFDLAYAWLLANRRGVADRVEFEMLLGMAPAHQQAVRRATGGLRLYTPVVPVAEFDAAISYLVRRLDEAASEENFLSGAFRLDEPEIFEREAGRFAAALAESREPAPESARTQNRIAGVAPLPEPPLEREPVRASTGPIATVDVREGGFVEPGLGFANEPDTDPSRAPNRAWARRVLDLAEPWAVLPRREGEAETGPAVDEHELPGSSALDAARLRDEADLRGRLLAGREAGRDWGARPAEERAAVLRRAATALATERETLIATMIAETGKTLAEADVEVSEAVDFARHAAARALELETVAGARFRPEPLVLVVPPWNFPVSIPAGGVLSALGAGSAVLLKPAPQARRCGAVLAETLEAAGLPRGVLQLVDVAEGEGADDLGRRLITAPEIGRVVLTGSIETARLFRSWRADLPLHAETSGKNSIIVTPDADLDLAVKDLVASAFGNAGQKCSAASLGILVGSVGRSERFRRQLADATQSLHVAWPTDPTAEVGPIVQPPEGKLEHALTRLDDGESWLVKPRQLDATDRLWSPGVRDGVRPGSPFHLTEYFGPVLGLIAVADLDEAIAVQNAVDYGLTAGIHSLDAGEVAYWLDRVQAGNLYVNRGITGAIVGRQPFGGWKLSSVGPGAKAGGPNTLAVLGRWESVDPEPVEELHLDGLFEPVADLVRAFQPALGFEGFALVRAGAFDDMAAWEAEFGLARDAAGLGVERNVFRYRPAEVHVRLAAGEQLGTLARVLAAGVLAGARVHVSTAVPLPSTLLAVVDPEIGTVDLASVVVEGDAAFAERMAAERPERIRLLGGDALALAESLGGAPETAVWAGPVTTAGRVELLPFLREQSVTITAHRFGNPLPAFAELEL
ncbi:MAG: proline dehydrogenase family protein [Actinomycetales bacterium]|nr:proline dehydrogenase family protein [Actinomycetales bacterium]